MVKLVYRQNLFFVIGIQCKSFLTVDINMHQGVQDWFHELIVQSLEIVVVQLDPLQAVEVLEGRSRDVLDPVCVLKYSNLKFKFFDR